MRVILPAAFLLCAAVAVRLTCAELMFRDNSAVQAHRALRLLGSTPNADYLERLADFEPDLEQANLELALAVNPRITSARIQLGLSEEQRLDLGSAERTLLEAARYDRQYLPAWTLANYYSRRRNQNAFWQWARAALRLDAGDPGSLVRLASLMESDEAAMLDHLHGGEQVAYSYMDLLISAGRLDSAQRVARIVLGAREIRKDQLIDLSTRQLKAGNIEWALEIWNSLHSPLDPEHGPVLAQDALETPDGEGFHVTAMSNDGIRADWRTERAAFSFEGQQADVCPLFEQPIAVPRHGMRYLLRYEYRNSATGVRWSFADRESLPLVLQEDWGRAEWIISVGPDSGSSSEKNSLRLLPLRLLYRREPGILPARGELGLRNLQLQIL